MINKIRAGLLASIAAAAIYIAQDTVLHETIILDGDVTKESIRPLLEEISNDSPLFDRFSTTRLILNSPGGLVNSLNLFRSTLTGHKRYLVTEVPVRASSAAADLFLLGDVRKLAKDAIVMIHEIRIMMPGGFMVTYTDLKALLETGDVAPNSKLNEVEKMVILRNIPKEFLVELVKELDKEHETHIKFIMERTGLTRDAVLKNLLIPNVDVRLNLEQALKFNVATEEL